MFNFKLERYIMEKYVTILFLSLGVLSGCLIANSNTKSDDEAYEFATGMFKKYLNKCMYCKQNLRDNKRNQLLIDNDCNQYKPHKNGTCGTVYFKNSLTEVSMKGSFETTNSTNSDSDNKNNHHLLLKTNAFNIDKEQIHSRSFSALPLEKQTLGHSLTRVR